MKIPFAVEGDLDYLVPLSEIILNKETTPSPIFTPSPEVSLWLPRFCSRLRIKRKAAANPVNRPAVPPMIYAIVFQFEFSGIVPSR